MPRCAASKIESHPGNVLLTVSDRRLPQCSATAVTGHTAYVISATDYSAFGAPLDGRTWNADGYRFGGAGGQEKDDEIFIGAYTAEYWEYDSRLGRRWNVDPVVKPWESGYACFYNNPIAIIDQLGLSGKKPGDKRTTSEGCNEVFKDGAWQDDPSYLKEVQISAQSPNTSEQWKKFVNNVGYEGYQSLINQLYQNKLSKYTEPNQINIGIYGQNSDGTVVVPNDIKSKLWQEANAEAMPLLKVIYATEVSGEDPTSFSYFINPLARASFLSAKAETVSSREEGLGILSEAVIEVGFAWYGVLKATGMRVDAGYYPGAKGVGVGVYINNQRSISVDMHRLHFNGKAVPLVPHIDIDFKYHQLKGFKKVAPVKHWPWNN